MGKEQDPQDGSSREANGQEKREILEKSFFEAEIIKVADLLSDINDLGADYQATSAKTAEVAYILGGASLTIHELYDRYAKLLLHVKRLIHVNRQAIEQIAKIGKDNAQLQIIGIDPTTGERGRTVTLSTADEIQGYKISTIINTILLEEAVDEIGESDD